LAARITTTTDDQYIQPRGYVLSNAGPTTGPFVSTDTVQAGPAGAGKVVLPTANLTLTMIPVNAITSGDTLVTRLPSLVAVAWQSDDVSHDEASVWVSDIATGTVEFVNGQAAAEGTLWCLHGSGHTEGP